MNESPPPTSCLPPQRPPSPTATNGPTPAPVPTVGREVREAPPLSLGLDGFRKRVYEPLGVIVWPPRFPLSTSACCLDPTPLFASCVPCVNTCVVYLCALWSPRHALGRSLLGCSDQTRCRTAAAEGAYATLSIPPRLVSTRPALAFTLSPPTRCSCVGLVARPPCSRRRPVASSPSGPYCAPAGSDHPKVNQ
ncbi:hypothetical protein BGZ61DRAFT_479196 [Ilyonectria robusta]|uniref:uncharacterized protein n=1 Tax=Ilyonectria robusta TaxID=1079257 RepID=UPI001E8DBC06|nr:uncharacterized protein BGZ61DRAFT_479196 [Ilyonectria robusta]KAH8686997.1 hypothetical protein BGZ61DRAFT_479196 [Ilyonectria robusta]